MAERDDSPAPPPAANELWLLSDKKLAARLDIGRSTLWRLVSEGVIPGPDVKLGKRLVRWSVPAAKAAVEQLAGEGAGAK